MRPPESHSVACWSLLSGRAASLNSLFGVIRVQTAAKASAKATGVFFRDEPMLHYGGTPVGFVYLTLEQVQIGRASCRERV